MKKVWKILLGFLVILGIILIIINAFNLDEKDYENKLYITCNNVKKSYDVFNNAKLSYDSEDNCKISLEVRNIDRNYIKLNSTLYLYKINDDSQIITGSLSNEIYVAPFEKLELLSIDKKTKFIFEYK